MASLHAAVCGQRRRKAFFHWSIETNLAEHSGHKTAPALRPTVPSTLPCSNLTASGLEGTMPREGWAFPSTLVRIDLSDNSLTGPISPKWRLPEELQLLVRAAAQLHVFAITRSPLHPGACRDVHA